MRMHACELVDRVGATLPVVSGRAEERVAPGQAGGAIGAALGQATGLRRGNFRPHILASADEVIFCHQRPAPSDDVTGLRRSRGRGRVLLWCRHVLRAEARACTLGVLVPRCS